MLQINKFRSELIAGALDSDTCDEWIMVPSISQKLWIVNGY
jgi:hypothetical protein